jgi:hypothetical protein
MANVQHSTLTGSDLHESKGAASASSGQVAIANGAGSAPFGVLQYTQLGATPIPKLQLNNVASTGQAIIKVYTTTAAAGLWSVTPTGFTTIWAVHAQCLSGSQAIGTTATATVATVSTSSITGANVVHSASANAISGTQTVYVTVIGV